MSSSGIHFELGKPSAMREDLYPDLKGRTLPDLVREELARIGSTLSVDYPDGLPEGFLAFASVKSPSRLSQIYVVASQRLFIVDFWLKGVLLAKGQTPRADLLVLAIDSWVAGQSTSVELAMSFPFVSVTEGAGDAENGGAVRRAWSRYLEDGLTSHPELAAFIHLAYEAPRLRQLFPYTSMWWFCFSRCTGYPYTADCPTVRSSREGQYTVTMPGGREISGLSAAQAVEEVLRNLPEGTGPAIDGTADAFQRLKN